MAGKNKEEVLKTCFYLYNDEWTISTKIKRISSPHNTLTLWRTKQDDTYRDISYVTFQGGVYETDNEKEIEWLSLYNNVGGTIELKVDGEIIKKKFKGDGTHQVKLDAPIEKRREVVIEKQVEVQQLPRVVVETMTIEQLQQLCSSWSVPATGAIKKEDYIKLLEESNKLS